MHEKKTPYGNKTKKHQPRGLSIIYEDYDIIVIDKIAGLLTMGTDREKEKTAYFILNDYVKKGNPRSRNRIFIVHRLDRDTSGLLVFAKNEKAKRYLQDNWENFDKKYFAVVHGILPEKEDTITSYLAENKCFRVYSVSNPNKGKLSRTGYRVIKEYEKYSLLEITLFTGRKNQIRVHLAEKGHPVVGDKVYGEKDKSVKRLALHSASLKILHPFTNKEMVFKTDLPPYFKTLVKVKESSK